MRFVLSLATLLLTGTALTLGANADGPKHDHHASATKASALDAFKALAGEWTGKMDHDGEGGDAVVTYKVTSGGSAVVETIGPGTEHEMVTIIHADGDDLVLTHYCAIGNQPRMRAPGKLADNKVAFAFEGATNLASAKAMHMHDVTFTFVDQDTIKSEWTSYSEGAPAGKAVFELKRKK